MKTEILAGSSGTYRKTIAAINYEGDFVVAKTTPSDAEMLHVIFVGGSVVTIVSMKDVEIDKTLIGIPCRR